MDYIVSANEIVSQFLIGKVELKFFKKIEELWPSDHVSIPYR